MQDLMKKEAKTNGRWTKDEHLKFLEGLRIYGKNWKKIQQFIQTRTGSQIRSHAQKFFLKLQENGKQQNSELSANFNEFKEQVESPTINSKSVSEPKTKNQSHSFFFNAIVEYWKKSNSLDFWASLVDYRCVHLTDERKPHKGPGFVQFNKFNALQIKNDGEERRSQN